MKYKVEVRRIDRLCINVEVEANSAEEAMQQAIDDAVSGMYGYDTDTWECYDCEYYSEMDDVEEVVSE